MLHFSSKCSLFTWALFFLLLGSSMEARIDPGSTLFAGQDQAWVSDNGTFAFGFAPDNWRRDRFQLGIWFAQLPGDRIFVWTPEINSPVSKDAVLEFQTNGNLVLTDGRATVWTSNSSTLGAESAVMSESGNFILYGPDQRIAWQSFSHPSDTLLPGQPLTATLELKSSRSPSQDGYYTLKMLQRPTSLSLALAYNLPEGYDVSSESSSNLSYWSAPDISNVTGDVIAVMNDGGSFGIVYGSSTDGAVFVHKNDNDNGGLSSAINRTTSGPPTVIRRLILETNGNLRLYRWDNDVNGSRQWVAEWAAVSKPCSISGICGKGICFLDKSQTNASCKCLPGTNREGNNDATCSENLSTTGKCGPQHEASTSQFKISTVQQTNYYFSDSSVIANYSDMDTVSKCGDACMLDCECVASVYRLNEEKPYCWVLRSLEFGGYEDAGSTLFVKVDKNSDSSEGFSKKKKILLPRSAEQD